VRVLLLNQTYLPVPVATSQYLGRWAEHLAREGHDLTVMASRRAYEDGHKFHPAREFRAGVQIVRVGSATPLGQTRIDRVVGFLKFLAAVFLRVLFGPKPDVIVALTTPPLLPAVAAMLAWLRGARLVVWAMDLHPEVAIAAGLLAENGLTAKAARAVSRWSLRRADRIIALDDHMRRALFLQGADPESVEVIPLWMQADIAFDAVGRASIRRARGWDRKFVVMCAGNHGACHSMETLLAVADALRDDPQIHFCWVGGGAQWGTLQEHAARNVTLIPYVPREKLAAVLSAADLQVVVMGDEFTGLLHPSKIYNILATCRPFLHIGPEKSPVADVMRKAGLGHAAASFRHGDRVPLACEIRRRARLGGGSLPDAADLSSWQEPLCLERLTLTLGGVSRFPKAVDELPSHPSLCLASTGFARAIAPAAGPAGLGHGG
jgi:glycosyltransferase involved in cell wall biosynthesis